MLTETITEGRQWVTDASTWVRALAELPDSTPENDAAIDAAVTEIEARRTELEAMETRATRLAAATAAVTGNAPGFHAPQVTRTENTDVRSMTRTEVRDAAMRIVEKEKSVRLSPFQADHLDRVLRTETPDSRGSVIAQRLVLTENDDYRSAWMKGVTQEQPLWTEDERKALNAYNEFRDMTEGTSAAGGYGIPVLIDPTIILTSQAADAPLLSVARVITITTNIWKGVSSAGVSWAYQAEGATVADDSPTLAQPSVTTYMARGFIPYSIEVGQDYPGFADEISMLLQAGYIDLLASKTSNGSGSSEPKGIFTAITASAGCYLTTATASTLVSADVTQVYAGIPERFRNRMTWFGNVDTEDKIRLLGTATTAGSFTVDLTQDGIPRLMGHTMLRSDYAPTLPASTTAGGFLIGGDFSQFIFVQRAGMSVELVPHLFDVTYNRPTGERGWFAWSRNGCDVATTNAFRVLMNKTS